MATQKQIEANRRNAQKSTGPKTEEGKSNSRLNSLQHGLGAIHVPLPHENPMELHDLRQGLIDTYQPANKQEMMLVDNIASAYLRMQRASRFEAALMNGQILNIKTKHGKSLDPDPTDDMGVILAMADENLEQAWRQLERYEKRATSAYYRGIETLRKLQNDRKREPARELKQNIERERYLRRTVAPQSAPKPATGLASFGLHEINPALRVPPRPADWTLNLESVPDSAEAHQRW